MVMILPTSCRTTPYLGSNGGLSSGAKIAPDDTDTPEKMIVGIMPGYWLDDDKTVWLLDIPVTKNQPALFKVVMVTSSAEISKNMAVRLDVFKQDKSEVSDTIIDYTNDFDLLMPDEAETYKEFEFVLPENIADDTDVVLNVALTRIAPTGNAHTGRLGIMLNGYSELN